MSTTEWERTGARLSLHGLGFLQLELTPTMRVHVWHPDLPRRRCAEHSSIHDHRFGFDSTVLVGSMLNRVYAPTWVDAECPKSYHLYRHDGPRGPSGCRPWRREPEPVRFVAVSALRYETGQTYHMDAYVFHMSCQCNDGRVATLMRKTSEGEVGARSSCLVGVEPEEDFDRFQMADDDMWAVVRDVLGG